MNNSKTLRNIIIFVIMSLVCGWIGLLFDKVIESSPDKQSLGMGIWLIFPLLTTLLLRLFAGDGRKDIGFGLHIKGNIQWYIVSLVIFPLVTAFIIYIGMMFGWVSITGFRTQAYLSVFGVAVVGGLVKNFFEESVWRGYLTAKLLTTKIKDIWLYLIVGGVWGLWHLPYYLYFLPEADMFTVLPVSRFSFAIVSVFTMICWSVMFVELYRLTKSIWSVVLLHTIEDSVVNHLIIDGHITIFSGKEIWVSPIVGILPSLLYIGVGILLRYYRIKQDDVAETSV